MARERIVEELIAHHAEGGRPFNFKPTETEGTYARNVLAVLNASKYLMTIFPGEITPLGSDDYKYADLTWKLNRYKREKYQKFNPDIVVKDINAMIDLIGEGVVIPKFQTPDNDDPRYPGWAIELVVVKDAPLDYLGQIVLDEDFADKYASLETRGDALATLVAASHLCSSMHEAWKGGISGIDPDQLMETYFREMPGTIDQHFGFREFYSVINKLEGFSQN